MTVLKWDDYRGIFDSIRHIGVMEIRGLSDVECYSKYWKDSTVEIELEMEEGKKIVEYEIVPIVKILDLEELLKDIVVYRPNNVFAPFVVRVEGVYSYFSFISPKLL